MDNKGPLNSASEGNHHIYVNFHQISNYIVTAPTPKNNTHYAVITLLHRWISKFGPPQ